MNHDERARQLEDATRNLREAGVEFIQIEMPDFSGSLRGKCAPLE